jgi:hypothetical protein
MLQRVMSWITYMLWAHLFFKIFLFFVRMFLSPTTHSDEYYSELFKNFEFWLIHYAQDQQRLLR